VGGCTPPAFSDRRRRAATRRRSPGVGIALRIVIASTFVAPGHGAGTHVASPLAAALEERGWEPEIVSLPVASEEAMTTQQALALRLLDLSSADRLVCIGAPSSLLRHPDKRVWLLSTTAPGPLALRYLTALGEARSVHAAAGARGSLLRAAGVAARSLELPVDGAGWDSAAAVFGA
jgi:hypothetical protein